jgi:hypothetical protein
MQRNACNKKSRISPFLTLRFPICFRHSTGDSGNGEIDASERILVRDSVRAFEKPKKMIKLVSVQRQ